ncbi:MAG TPA: tyrosine-type recombinase/integrase [Caldilinea sp.]|nr:tyrosine-type recombinase/integrase [Caldilinea sp.]
MNRQVAVTAPEAQKVDHQAATAYLMTLSATGRASMLSSLKLVARVMGAADIGDVNWASLNAANVQALVARVRDTPTERGEPRAPASVTAVLNGLKGVAKAAWRRNTLSTDTWERIRDVKPPRGSRLPAGRDIAPIERAVLISAAVADDRVAGMRDSAILAMLMATGIRRAELVALALEDIDLTTGKIKIIGKGDKERTSYVADEAMDALRDWLGVRGQEDGPLFCPITKSGNLQRDRHMSATALHYIISRRTAAAGLNKITPHDFRRTLAGDLLDSNVDISTVSELLGHADPKTTKRYDRRGDRAKRRAVDQVHVPYKRG